MKSKLVHEQNGLRTFVVVMDKGDEAFNLLGEFAAAEAIAGASITAIGACSGVTLGYFDPDAREYRSTRFDEQLELLSLIGDVALQGGKPTVHAHVVLGRRDSSAIGGHLQSADVYPTMEIVVTEVPEPLRKRFDDEVGLALIDLG